VRDKSEGGASGAAHRFTAFDEWEPRFSPTRARYVRLRLTRKGFLDLDGMRVFGRRRR